VLHHCTPPREETLQRDRRSTSSRVVVATTHGSAASTCTRARGELEYGYDTIGAGITYTCG
jgi:hypothetical protein